MGLRCKRQPVPPDAFRGEVLHGKLLIDQVQRVLPFTLDRDGHKTQFGRPIVFSDPGAGGRSRSTSAMRRTGNAVSSVSTPAMVGDRFERNFSRNPLGFSILGGTFLIIDCTPRCPGGLVNKASPTGTTDALVMRSAGFVGGASSAPVNSADASRAGFDFRFRVRPRTAASTALVFPSATPRCGRLTRNQHACADAERHGHQAQRSQFVEKLRADAMTRAKFVNAVGVGVIACVDRFATGNFGTRHALSSILEKPYGVR